MHYITYRLVETFQVIGTKKDASDFQFVWFCLVLFCKLIPVIEKHIHI